MSWSQQILSWSDKQGINLKWNTKLQKLQHGLKIIVAWKQQSTMAYPHKEKQITNLHYTWSLRDCNDFIFNSQMLRNSDNKLPCPAMIFLTTPAALQDCSASKILGPTSAPSLVDETVDSNTSMTFPGPWLLFFSWIEENMVSNVWSSGLLSCSFNHLVTTSIVSQIDWIECCISRDSWELDCSMDPAFFFFLLEGGMERTRDWMIKECQASGSVTSCTSKGRLVPGEEAIGPADATVSWTNFLSKILTRFQLLPEQEAFPSENLISLELRFQAFRNTAKFSQSMMSGLDACKRV